MVQAPLARSYTDLSGNELFDKIENSRRILGEEILILGHHYQRDEIICHVDFTGDSYKLAKNAVARPRAKSIIFCGVHFMAESADILTGDSQSVILPNLSAGCSMADMANLFQVRNAWRQLETVLGSDIKSLIPITYINSAANLKAFVGERDGTVCTSTNAPIAVQWALNCGEKVLFFPDQHLGRNTGVKLGFDPDRDMIVWDPAQPLGGNSEESIRNATFILWKGHCSVHQRFTTEQILKARIEDPKIKILVHPECPLDVVQAADFNGSTEFIIQTVTDAPAGTSWGIGTEINLVSRLAKQFPEKRIFCLDPQVCPCSTMYRIHPSYLAWVLDQLLDGNQLNVIKVPENVKIPARKALETMLTITG